MYSSPKVFLPSDSSRIQLELSNKVFSNSTFESVHKPSGLTSVAEKSSQMINRRLKNHRHPLSGMRAFLPDMVDHFTSSPDFFTEDNKTAHRLNSRILETWINNTISDASALNIPGQVLKEDSKLPLMRFGIDRTTLLKSGLQAPEVDRLYRSLFVYSIGFYQLIQKILEHTNKKYTIVTGVWKVYAILLEYCCQLDYQMIITTLNLEKREEIEQLETEFQAQINKIENHEKELESTVSSAKQQLEDLQKELNAEVVKREEIEDELMRRGNGHEEEVVMRLQFESKLNQMYAKLRDLQTKLEILNENLQEIQKENILKTDQLQRERLKCTQLIKQKTEAELELRRIEEVSKQTESVNASLEKKVTENYETIENLSVNLSNLNAKHNETINELAQKKIEIDDLRFSLEVVSGNLRKVEMGLEESSKEKEFSAERIKELEKTLEDEVAGNQHYKQEYFRIKEIEAAYSVDLIKFKSKCEEQETSIDEIVRQRDAAIIQLDAKSTLCEELKLNLKDTQVKLEEMNKGRRVVEEHNKSLKSRIEELLKEIADNKHHIKSHKEDIDRLKAREVELDSEINELRIKLQSLQKQFSATKETFEEKVSNLNEILESEKKIRENWIYRFEEEQKNHSNSTKELIQTHDRLNEARIKIGHLETTLEESNFQRSNLSKSQKENLEEIMTLKFVNEDYKRKNKTMQVLIENIDQNYKAKMNEVHKETEAILEINNEKMNSACMRSEEAWAIAAKNLQETLDTQREYRKIKLKTEEAEKKLADCKKELEQMAREFEGKSMVLEEARVSLIDLNLTVGKNQEERKKIENKLSKAEKALIDFKNLAPADLRNAPNPFRIMTNQIQELRKTIEDIENSKPVLKDKQMQWDDPGPEKAEKEVQTDKIETQSKRDNSSADRDRSGFESEAGSKPEVSRSSSSTSKNKFNKSLAGSSFKSSEGSNANFMDLPVRKKSSRVRDLEDEEFEGNSTLHRDDDRVTPLNLRSIYTKEIKEDSGKSPAKLPVINQYKRNQQASPILYAPSPIPILPSADFKRAIKQAVSRKRNNE